MGIPKKQSLDEAKYLELESGARDRHEFIDGMVYAMARAGERHNRIALNCAVALRIAARGSGCGVYVADMRLRLSRGRVYYYPDVMLSCESATPDTMHKEAPCFIAEVLSPSTAVIDAREKVQAYRNIPELRYYLFIDSERVQLTCHTRTPEGEWLTGSLEKGEALEVSCAGMTARVSLADLYEDTDLAA